MGDNEDRAAALAVYQTVRCLDCGFVYAKPTRGGTATSNPGCPECGYVGWLAADLPVREPAPRRYDEGLRQGRSA